MKLNRNGRKRKITTTNIPKLTTALIRQMRMRLASTSKEITKITIRQKRRICILEPSI
jgi:hypothetical protein